MCTLYLSCLTLSLFLLAWSKGEYVSSSLILFVCLFSMTGSGEVGEPIALHSYTISVEVEKDWYIDGIQGTVK
jgi:hypothetical protein